MTAPRELEGDPHHPILPRPWEFEILALRLDWEPPDGTEPFLDLRLRRGNELRALRFWSPADLEIERGGPVKTSGLVILDLRSRGLDRIEVRVDDIEASPGAMRFVARAVEEIEEALG